MRHASRTLYALDVAPSHRPPRRCATGATGRPCCHSVRPAAADTGVQARARRVPGSPHVPYPGAWRLVQHTRPGNGGRWAALASLGAAATWVVRWQRLHGCLLLERARGVPAWGGGARGAVSGVPAASLAGATGLRRLELNTPVDDDDLQEVLPSRLRNAHVLNGERQRRGSHSGASGAWLTQAPTD